jgi:MFS family permease
MTTASRSHRGLDWLNFFVADIQTGFGPFVAVYLTTQAWTEVQIGFALSLGTLTAMISQIPAGVIVDSARDKRGMARIALMAIALSALLLAAFPARLPVYLSEILHGFASCVLNPCVAAISLALVGRQALGERLGRNARYASMGGALSAGVMGLIGTYLSPAAVFYLTAVLTVPSLIALSQINAAELQSGARLMAEKFDPKRDERLRELFSNRGILVFAGCAALFTLSNAAMLPLAGAAVTRRAGDEANLIIAACLMLPQLIVVLISPWIGRVAQSHGRRIVLIIGFAMLPVRGMLLALVEEPAMLILVQALDGISAATLNVMLPLLAADLTRGTNRFNLCIGVFGLAVGVGGTISTTLGGAVAAWSSPAAAFVMLGGIGLLCLVLAWLAMPETRELPVGQAVPAR